MIDIILAIIAYFVISKLIKSLGRTNDDKIIEGEYKIIETTNSTNTKDSFISEQELEYKKSIEKNMTNADLEKMRLLEQQFGFEVVKFVNGVKKACAMVTTAIADNDMYILKSLLTPSMLEKIQQTKQDIIGQNIRYECTFIGIDNIKIINIRIEQNNIYIELKITSEQINAIFDAHNNVISGNPKKVITITEEWTFHKNMQQESNIWYISDIKGYSHPSNQSTII